MKLTVCVQSRKEGTPLLIMRGRVVMFNYLLAACEMRVSMMH